ncbi:MAG: hypothetical protein PHW69_00450 [Elusimicrobiaceae bacterium]|nr:hypothetical protein [Elusimicrobiaceae bacterium]
MRNGAAVITPLRHGIRLTGKQNGLFRGGLLNRKFGSGLRLRRNRLRLSFYNLFLRQARAGLRTGGQRFPPG